MTLKSSILSKMTILVTYTLTRINISRIGKFYNATCVETDDRRTILILEAEDIHKALNILNEGFLFNGIPHKNILKFYGCYMN